MAPKNQYILFELASGYCLFLRKEGPDLEALLKETTVACSDFARFKTMVSFVAFAPFTAADQAVENVIAINVGEVSDFLKAFLKQQIGGGKKESVQLGVADAALGKTLQETCGFTCVCNDTILEIMRWIRYHVATYLPDQKEADVQQAQLGLAHGWSRTIVKTNVNRSDNMIIQAISLLDQMDKDINTFAMRVKEWYGWHFPELKKIVGDSAQFCSLVICIRSKSTLSKERFQEIADIVGDDDVANEVIAIAPISMGMDFVDADFANIECFARRVLNLTKFRKQLHTYLVDKMNSVAPNLSALIGDQIGGRLICQAGSLTNLAKYPASTVQILGAEKALFRALKMKGNTPKYGLIYHSSFIQKAPKEHKGRISRFLANKASICSRLDCFLDTPNRVFGDILSAQVDERLKSLQSGEMMATNQEIMEQAVKKYQKSLKRKRGDAEEVAEEAAPADTSEAKRLRKEEKKNRKQSEQATALNQLADEAGQKKKKKSKQ